MFVPLFNLKIVLWAMNINYCDVLASPLVSANSGEPRPSYPRTQYSVSRAHVTLDPGSSAVAGQLSK